MLETIMIGHDTTIDNSTDNGALKTDVLKAAVSVTSSLNDRRYHGEMEGCYHKTCETAATPYGSIFRPGAARFMNPHRKQHASAELEKTISQYNPFISF
ncbi:hypothetical protein NPIL_335691 [Nephila pilipes]|uniref:Uncharacterized protein n=1 Tax=Nephila pilipes TaxID=299642 RepID=A0A8X6TU86_NEPPI|nr:hypothetical protein NPIL_335691 [Nephila pilipes]